MELWADDVIYQFKIEGKRLEISIIWRGVPIKRFRMKAPAGQALKLRQWLNDNWVALETAAR